MNKNRRDVCCGAEARHERAAGVSVRENAGAEPRLQNRSPRQWIAPGASSRETAIAAERMRQAIEATDLAIWDYDLESGAVHLSDAWSWLRGGPRKPTDTNIQQLSQLVPEPDREMVREAIIKAVKGEPAAEYQVTHRVTRLDGSVMWVQSEGRVVQRAPDGRALRMMGVNRDITQRKLLEDQLLRREARYRAVIDATVDGFMVLDTEGRVQEVNDIYVRQSGYSRAELLQMRVEQLEAAEHPEEVAAHRLRIKKHGHDRFESEHRRKDGTIWPIEVEVTHCSDLGLSFVFAVDNTERRRTERKMAEHRAELEALQRSQIAAQTAAAFAHELNQPLGAIVTYAEAALMMLRKAAPDLDKVCDTLTKGRDQALRAGDAIRELLALLSTDLDAVELVDLNREIRQVLTFARTDTGLRFRSELRLEPGLPAVRVNQVHLKKVLLNLLNNAVEAMREAQVPEPSIIVTVRTCRDDGLAQITVQDSGPGVSERDVAHLFEPFFTTKTKGIGMGLAISRTLIEANGGQLWCDPAEGPGAAFHLTLPFAE